LIGPEGDFHPDEITEIMLAGFHALDLGNTRLRTETAALLVSFAFSDCLK
jgi:16S rRNA (uracil1498-N3)-methyltransferase